MRARAAPTAWRGQRRARGRAATLLRRDRRRGPHVCQASSRTSRPGDRMADRDGRIERTIVSAVPPDQVRRVGVVGAGVIGGGWALHYLRMGLDVDVYDPAPAARSDLLRMRTDIWPLLERIGLRPGASPDRLVLHADLASAVSDADMVQEN